MSKIYNVTNRSSSLVFYQIPEENINRQFTPGETKKIGEEELRSLTYQAGGPALVRNYLYIAEQDGVDEFAGTVEPEYYLDEDGIKNLILKGSLDEFLDCLDYAPEGVMDLIKKWAVDLPITDANKNQALKDKTGFDAFVAIKNNKASQEETITSGTITKERRVKSQEPAAAARRTSGSQYKVVSE